MKYFKIFLFGTIFLFALRVFLPFLDLYPYQLTKEYFLIGYGSNNYCIKDGYFGKIILSSMERDSEWMIDSDYIYGHKGNYYNLEDDYFIINRKNNSSVLFSELSELNNYLSERNIKSFNMTDSESVLHLRINKRKYNLKH